jgi:hypothetical protein
MGPMKRTLRALSPIVIFFQAVACVGQTIPKPLHSREAQGVSPEERQGLVALYEATDGIHWKNHVGWLGVAGTECTWEGVRCKLGFDEPSTVTDLELSETISTALFPKRSVS